MERIERRWASLAVELAASLLLATVVTDAVGLMNVSFYLLVAGVPLTDTSVVAIDDPTALFLLGALGRASFKGIIETLPAAHWTEPFEFSLLGSTVRATPRKVVLHVLTHEIRHWAQVTTLLRLQGWIGERQDLLFSPVLGDPIQLQNLP